MTYMKSQGKTISPTKITQEDTSYLNMLKNNPTDWDLEMEGELAVDVLETPNDIIVRSAIAGIDPENLSVHATLDTLTIRGRREACNDFPFTNTHVQECHWGSFSRTIILPHNILIDEVVATMRNGVLTVVLPKMQEPHDVHVFSLDE
jgi:HSP20 family molecular chaperone IbpA